MKRFIIILLIFVTLLFAGAWKETADIIDNYNAVMISDSTTFVYADTLYILGGDSIIWFVPQEKSLGNIWYHGTIISIDTVWTNGSRYGLSLTDDTTAYAGQDTVYISEANHRGNGTAYSTKDSFVALDTILVDSAGTANFSFYVKQDSTISAIPCEYYAIKFKNKGATCAGGIVIKEEKIRQY